MEFPRELVHQAQNGDVQARDLLFGQAAAFAKRLIMEQGFDLDTVDELLQNVSVRLLKVLGNLRNENNFGSFVVLATTNAIVDHFREVSRRRRHVTCFAPRDMESVRTQAPAAETAEFHQLRARFVDVLDALPPELHLVFMQWAQKRTVKEMAERMRVSVRTVKRKKAAVFRAIAKGLWGDDPPHWILRRLRS